MKNQYIAPTKDEINPADDLRNPTDQKNIISDKIKPSIPGSSALHLFLILLGGIFAADMIVMLIIKAFPPLPQLVIALLDSTFLLILSYPLLYFFVFRKLKDQITESIQTGEALTESEATYSTLVEKLPDGVYKSTHDGKFVDVNPAMVKILGYESKEELLAIDIKTQLYFEPGDRESLVLEEKLKEMGIYRLKKKDGSGVWVEDHGWYNLGETGEILFHEGILRDITHRRQEELERQVIYEISHAVTMSDNLNELLKLIHQSLGKVLYADNCFVALHDKNTGLFSFPYFEDQFDSTPQPIAMSKSCTAYVFRTGKPFLITPELFNQLKEQNEVELIGSPSPSWIGVPLKTPDRTIGVLVLQHYEKENIFSESDIQFLDSVGGQIAMAIDRRWAEEERRQSEIKLNVILQSTADGILAIDGNGKVIKTNKRFTELWRIPQDLSDLGDDDSLLNFVLTQLTNPDEFISKVQKLYHSYDKDLDNIHFKDGRIFERFSAPLIMPDSSVGRVWSFRDITERKLAEEKIQLKNEELQKINAEKDKFFSIISHDLRSPFNGFLGLTKLMVENLPDLTTDQVQKFAVSMQKSASNLYRLLENLLEWSQIQKGVIQFNPEIVQLQMIVDENVEMFNESAKSKGIEITTNVAAGLVVFADINMLETVIRNLVSNAVKFTVKGGKVSISAETTNDNLIKISVQDTGIGMSQTQVENLFRIDVLSSRKGTEDEPGSGLGLLLCKEFIEKHGGKIWAESEVGIGSTFYFTLPQ